MQFEVVNANAMMASSRMAINFGLVSKVREEDLNLVIISKIVDTAFVTVL